MSKTKANDATREYVQTDERGTVRVTVSYGKAKREDPGYEMRTADGEQVMRANFPGLEQGPRFEPRDVMIDIAVKLRGVEGEQAMVLPLSAWAIIARAVARTVPRGGERPHYMQRVDPEFE